MKGLKFIYSKDGRRVESYDNRSFNTNSNYIPGNIWEEAISYKCYTERQKYLLESRGLLI